MYLGFRVILCLFTPLSLSAQQIQHADPDASCVVEDIDTPTMPACVIQERDGVLYIPKRFWMHPSFNRYGLSPFFIESFGRVYVNRTGRIIIRGVAFMDNGTDDFHHGLVRINRGGMWGFADPTGRIVVPVKFSCALNYADSYQNIGPIVCVGCHDEQQGEYNACVGGHWFLTDRHGHLTPAPNP